MAAADEKGKKTQLQTQLQNATLLGAEEAASADARILEEPQGQHAAWRNAGRLGFGPSHERAVSPHRIRSIEGPNLVDELKLEFEGPC